MGHYTLAETLLLFYGVFFSVNYRHRLYHDHPFKIIMIKVIEYESNSMKSHTVSHQEYEHVKLTKINDNE